MEKIKKSWITLFVISVLMLITYWFEECWWSWKNCIGAVHINVEDYIKEHQENTESTKLCVCVLT